MFVLSPYSKFESKLADIRKWDENYMEKLNDLVKSCKTINKDHAELISQRPGIRPRFVQIPISDASIGTV
jgi:hypothetical protein